MFYTYVLLRLVLIRLYATLALFSVNLKTLYGWTDIFLSLSPFETKEESFVSKYVLNRLETSQRLPSGRYCKLPLPPPSQPTPPVRHILSLRLFLFALCKHWVSSRLRQLERCYRTRVVRKVTGSSLNQSDTFICAFYLLLLRIALLFFLLFLCKGY